MLVLSTGTLLIGIIAVIISAFFLWIGAKMANVSRSTFGRSIIAAILTVLITWFVTWIFSALFHIGGLLGPIIGIVVSIFVIKSVFATSFGRALLVWIFSVIAQFVAVIIGIFVFGIAVL